MKVSLFQIDIAWGDPKANREHIEPLLMAAEKSDLYVLPEMFTTGFVLEPDGIAETDGSTLEWMKQMAKKLNGAVCGSVAVAVLDANCNKSFRNRLYFVKPNGNVTFYDKRHLFSYSGEDKHYTPGDSRVVVEYKGIRFLLQVCYDLRFPTFSRNNEKVPYDVAIYVSSWPTSRLFVWNTLLHARALENQCYVIGVNRTGDDPDCRYSGGTIMIDSYGSTLAASPLGEESTITVTFDTNALRVFRRKFPVLKDCD